jgi:hypothetical protein
MRNVIIILCLSVLVTLQSVIHTTALENKNTINDNRLLSRKLQTDNEYLCNRLLEKHQWGCTCSDVLEDGGDARVAFDCSMCEICDFEIEPDQTCTLAEYAHLIENNTTVTHRTKFKYTSGGRTEEFLLEQDCTMDEELDLTCTSCIASVNNETCNSCELPSCGKDGILPFTSIPKFDCSNIEEGAIYDPCAEDQQIALDDLMYGPDLAIENCLRTVTPDSLSTEVIAKCSAATKLEIGADQVANYFDELVEARDICGSQGYYTAAKFYEVVGNGNIFTASTCRDNTTRLAALSVFSGGCENLQCAAGQSHQHPLCGDEDAFVRFNSDEVSWKTEPDEIYHIIVMVIEAGDVQIGLTETAPPTNTECETAEMEGLTTSGTPVTGNTVDGGPGPSCDIFFNGEQLAGRGVWYKMLSQQANQTAFVASTCSDVTNFAADIRIFYGDCGSLTCVDDLQYDTCDGFGSRVIWSPNIANENYYIYVTSPFSEELGDAGTFSLTLSEIETAPNSYCTEAVPVDVGGEKVVGSTIAVADDGFLPSVQVEDEFQLVAQPGLWYSVSSDSTSTLQLSTCFEETDPDFLALIFVYEKSGTESCDSMELIAVEWGNDAECEFAVGTRVTWTVDEGKEYLLYIASENGT